MRGLRERDEEVFETTWRRRKRRAQKWNSEDTSEARKILTHDGSANNNIKS